jgi:hypothetical protein
LVDLKNSSPLKPLGQMIWNLVGSIYIFILTDRDEISGSRGEDYLK